MWISNDFFNYIYPITAFHKHRQISWTHALFDLIKRGELIRNVLTICLTDDDHILGGFRDLSILSLLYSSGMRVSELVGLEFSNIFFEEEYIKIMGKGKKERLVPIGLKAKKHLINYMR